MNFTETNPRENARLGMAYLEQSVIGVLLEARESGSGSLGATEIAKRAGIPAKAFKPAFGNAITSGILARLSEQKRIEQSYDKGPWRLTEEEFTKLEATSE